jgi:hypothetical protein
MVNPAWVACLLSRIACRTSCSFPSCIRGFDSLRPLQIGFGLNFSHFPRVGPCHLSSSWLFVQRSYNFSDGFAGRLLFLG